MLCFIFYPREMADLRFECRKNIYYISHDRTETLKEAMLKKKKKKWEKMYKIILFA